MIIFGTRGVTSTAERGQFNCPRCQSPQSYNLKRVRRFFTLYFIPLIPLDKLGEYVECPRCQGTYDTEILDYDPSQDVAEIEAFFFIAVKQVMIAILLADGEIDDNEVKALQSIYEDLTQTQIPEDELREEIAVIEASGSSALELLSQLSATLNNPGKEMVIRAAYQIAAADGHVDDSELQLIGELGQTMEMSNAHVNSLMQEVANEQQRLAG